MNTHAQLLREAPCRARLPAQAWGWLAQFRRRALSDFQRQGVPAARDEAWKYTPVTALGEQRFLEAPDPPATAPQTLAGPATTPREGVCFTFVAGRLLPPLPEVRLPAGAKLLSLGRALSDERALIERYLGSVAQHAEHPFVALNSAHLADGLLLYLPAGCRLEQPVLCRFWGAEKGEAQACFPRLLVVLEEDAQAELVEAYIGQTDESAHLTDRVCEVRLAAGAEFRHRLLLADGAQSSHIGALHLRAERGSRFHSFSLGSGGALCRSDLRVSLVGEGAQAHLDGLFLLAERAHWDTHLRIDHRVPACRSEVLYKGVLAGRSRGVFNGLAVVHPDAQRSEARQVNRNLLLSEGAEVDTKPELQIEADDVQCSHGATVGNLDPAALFYLRSRGLTGSAARGLLTEAFAREALARLAPTSVRQWLEREAEIALARLIGEAL